MSDIHTDLYDGFTIHWEDSDLGFGQFYFYRYENASTGEFKIKCSNELMSKEYIKKVLCAMVDNCELEC